MHVMVETISSTVVLEDKPKFRPRRVEYYTGARMM